MHDVESLPRRLRSDGLERDMAITELREILVKGLSRSLNNRYCVQYSVEDIVQESLIKILASIDQFEGRSKFTTWALTIANRIGISSLRRKYHQDISMEAFQSEDGFRIDVAVYHDPIDTEKSEVLEVLQSLIDSELTEKQRMALRAFLAGFSTDGIAERVGTNRNAVYKLIHDARIKLKDGLERAGITADDFQSIFA